MNKKGHHEVGPGPYMLVAAALSFLAFYVRKFFRHKK